MYKMREDFYVCFCHSLKGGYFLPSYFLFACLQRSSLAFSVLRDKFNFNVFTFCLIRYLVNRLILVLEYQCSVNDDK